MNKKQETGLEAIQYTGDNINTVLLWGETKKVPLYFEQKIKYNPTTGTYDINSTLRLATGRKRKIHKNDWIVKKTTGTERASTYSDEEFRRTFDILDPA